MNLVLDAAQLENLPLDGAQIERSQTVLVVDDDPAACELLSRIFSAEYHVKTVFHAQDALTILHADTPIDMVLLDINLPDTDGFALLTQIRARPQTHELPVILISARDDSNDIVHGLHLGANDYITKPLNIDIVYARVSAQLAFKKLSDQHKQMIEALQVAHKMQQRFYQIVSHDLKGPLTNLRMAQYLLRDLLPDDTQVGLILDNADLSLNEMQDLIRVFLDVAAVQPGQVEIEIDCIHVHDTLKNIVRQYHLTAGRKSIQLELIPGSELIMADHRLLSQMVGNLVSNAIKYSPAHTITRLWTEVRDSFVRIYVADGGPGIPIGERDGLFEMFGKLSTRPTGTETSTGVGLWIVKYLAELQKGSVGVHCPAEGGSHFWIDFPSCAPVQPTHD